MHAFPSKATENRVADGTRDVEGTRGRPRVGRGRVPRPPKRPLGTYIGFLVD